MIQRGLIVAASLCVIVGFGAWKSGVLTSEPADAAETTQAATTTKADASSGAAVDGFRSAKFGDSEDAVRKAISKDFGKSGDDVKTVVNPTQRTKALIVRAKDLIPDTGEARITYILGYKSKSLIQVNVLWGTAVTPDVTEVAIARTALILKNYFNGQGYDRKRTIRDRRLKNGVLVFQSTDSEKRLVRLLYIDVPIKQKDAKAATDDKSKKKSAYALSLNYIADPANPDILKIKPGSF